MYMFIYMCIKSNKPLHPPKKRKKKKQQTNKPTNKQTNKSRGWCRSNSCPTWKKIIFPESEQVIWMVKQKQ